MVETGGEELDLVDRDADHLGQLLVRVLHGVAEADRVGERRALPHRPREHRHRVGVVEQDRVRAQLGHVVRDVDEHGDRPQPAKHAPDPDCVADRLAQPVPLGDLEVAQRGVEAANLDLVDDVVGVVERRPPIEVSADLKLRAGLVVDVAGDPLGRVEPLFVDVVERDRRPRELRELAHVGQQDPCELDAARADKRDVRHDR